MRKEKSKAISVLSFLLLFFIVGIIVAVIVLMNTSRITNTEDEMVDNDQSALICSKGASSDDYFYIPDASNVEQKIKIVLLDKSSYKIFYEYSGQFASSTKAKDILLEMNIDYDLDMQKADLSVKPSSSFINIGSTGKIELYGVNNVINNTTAKLFFIDEESIEIFRKNDVGNMEKYYKKIGFKCKRQ